MPDASSTKVPALSTFATSTAAWQAVVWRPREMSRGTALASACNNIPCTLFRRSYFTNTDQRKKSDPFAALGLEYGATATEIKEAYRRKARELHPDVSHLEPSVALEQFRVVKEAYDKLMNTKNATHRTDLWEEWSFAIWRGGDLIAQERTDVAGAMRKSTVSPLLVIL